MAESSTSGLTKALEAVRKCDKQNNYREWKEKKRQMIALHASELSRVLGGAPCPAAADSAGVVAWKKGNSRLYSVLFSSTTGSAHITVRAHSGDSTPGSVGDGAAAWQALQARFDGSTKEARRALQKRLYTLKMKSGEDPTDFIATNLRLRLEDTGEKLSDGSYTDLLLHALTPEIHFVMEKSYELGDAFDYDMLTRLATNY